MPINTEELEMAIRHALPVNHLYIEDESNGCGENYSIVLVSEVSPKLCCLKKLGGSSIYSHSKANPH